MTKVMVVSFTDFIDLKLRFEPNFGHQIEQATR